MADNQPTKIIESYLVPEQQDNKRLSDFAIGIFKNIPSRKALKKAIKSGLIYIDGKQGYTGDYITGGEVLDLYMSEEIIKRPNVDIDIEVLYEDDYLAVVNKPAGIEVSGNKRRTLENALQGNLQKSESEDALDYPEPIHRLDFPTSGVLLIGKTRLSVIALNKLFECKQVEKIYFAIAIGEMPSDGVIAEDIEGKPSETKYEVVDKVASERFEFLNLVKLLPLTGRRHQLRIHLSGMGNSILGDSVYSPEELLLKGKGLFLHAAELTFIHPQTNKQITILAKTPNKFHRILH
ncbi:RluA family pseudouridine synthase [bacterium]|nr:RluA family pseudouridine synthase [bacterium]